MLTGKLIRFREFRADDIPAVTAMRNDVAVRAGTTRSLIIPISESSIRRDFEAPYNPVSFPYILETLEGRFIGFCKFNNSFKDRRTTVSLEIKPEEHGKEYGSDALTLILNMVFLEMNMNKCATLLLASNEVAIHLLKKAGFTVEVVLREDVYRHGAYQDALFLGLLKEEYLASLNLKNESQTTEP